MRNRIFVAAGLAVAGCASPLFLSTGIAAADNPDVVGKKYSEAKQLLSQADLTPVVATVVGDRVSQDECFVVSTSKITSRDASGNAANNNDVRVNLSCYARPADRVTPGFSAGNLAPDAEAVREENDAETKKWLQSPDGQKYCAKQEAEHPEWGPIPDCHVAG